MSILYISEYTEAGIFQGNMRPVVDEPSLASQALTYSTTAASTAFNAKTRIVRIHTDSICSIKFGTGTPTAATTDIRLAANQTEYFAVPLGKSFKVAAIDNT